MKYQKAIYFLLISEKFEDDPYYMMLSGLLMLLGGIERRHSLHFLCITYRLKKHLNHKFFFKLRLEKRFLLSFIELRLEQISGVNRTVYGASLFEEGHLKLIDHWRTYFKINNLNIEQFYH